MLIDAPIGKWISRLYKHHEQFIDEKLEAYNLKHSEANLLVHLYRDRDGVNQEVLTANLGVDKATVSRAVKALLEKSYLFRQRSLEDGRVNLIFLSEKAEGIKSIVRKVYQDWYDLIMGDIPDDEAKIMLRNLEKMYNFVQNDLS
ncbi:MarR family winged helix-turn-helix transcriptional regulator [Halocella sp. SP3-1]|uniref:MarR family winged helix-turn-helix transcriptional regulator n=1 Tax=Halocella sp. SP3-1 TaxID=2382161 RepID=UPI000F752898|nr:MarR family winged helix-turn-helix transcriptional regulator [Halocella sp. SP3-1]AZO95894.1 MarR family transcriptional regulator [Halocella sp. SP3-1]MTI61575.1 winged helix-turn-helix transcriptional regulator [Bacillota bacterium]